MSVRQQILDILESRLANIQEVNIVGQWIVGSLGINDLPAISIKDTKSATTHEDVPIDSVGHRMTVELEILVEGDNAISTLDNIIEQTLDLIGNDETMGGLCEWCHLEGVFKDVDQKENKIVAANIELSIAYTTKRWGI